MRLDMSRDELLRPLQSVMGVVEKRQTMPILANILMVYRDDTLTITASDLEVEMIAQTTIVGGSEGEITVSGRKLMDICRNLPEGLPVSLHTRGDRLYIQCGGSRFNLATLPAADFPAFANMNDVLEFSLTQTNLKKLLQNTSFAMAQQDVRHYLNGLLIEFRSSIMRAVATDGHRLALCDAPIKTEFTQMRQVIVPRKGILELLRLLTDSDDAVLVQLGTNHIRINLGQVRFTSKLLEGRFPDYERVIPKSADNQLVINRQMLRQGLARAAILSNERYRGVRLTLASKGLTMTAHNAEQEQAEEEIETRYQGESLEIGFNVNYLMEPLGILDSEEVSLKFTGPNGSCIITTAEGPSSKHVVMPMRL